MKCLRNKKGILLVASIMLIVFVSLAVFGVTTFIIQRLIQTQTKQSATSCLYSALAGMHSAIYNFRFFNQSANGYFSLGQTNMNADNYFVLGVSSTADLLMINPSSANLSGKKNHNLKGIRIQNATNSQTITIDRMIISWDNTRKLRRIKIGGQTVWKGKETSPFDADISDFTLNATPIDYPINTIRFNKSMIGATVNVQFVMTDGSTKDVVVYPASNINNFTVLSTGKSTGSSTFRTVKAEYNILTAKIINYEEINTEITP